MATKLTLEQRKSIEVLLHSSLTHKEICEKVGIYESTLYREFKKCRGAYNAEEAHENTVRGRYKIDYEIIGKTFGNLTVIGYANRYKGRTWWKCKCACGKDCVVSRKTLTDYFSPQRPTSCGCVPKQYRKENYSFDESCRRKYEDLLAQREINGECWDWKGFSRNNIPMTSWRSQTMSVRKCMYLIKNKIEHEKRPVHAKCGNRMCFNPDHIALGNPPRNKENL